jgi:hypothetical protein
LRKKKSETGINRPERLYNDLMSGGRESEDSARIPARRLRVGDRLLDLRRAKPLAAVTRQDMQNYRDALNAVVILIG